MYNIHYGIAFVIYNKDAEQALTLHIKVICVSGGHLFELPTKDAKKKPVHTGLYLVRKGMFRGCDIPFYF